MDLALMRLGVPMVPASLSLTSPAFRLGLGLTGGALSDLTGSYLSGTGISLGSRLGEWKMSGVAARPYIYGSNPVDTGAKGELANARVEHPIGSGNLSITATHISDPGIARRLDAGSVGASFEGTAIGDLTSEMGYRRYSAGAGLGWSAELRRQTENGSFSVRTLHAPGGAIAYARATDDMSAAASRRFGDWLSFSGAYWRSGDGSSVFGSSSGSGWNAGPTFSSHSLGTNLSLQARGSSIGVIGQQGSFGNGESQLAALLDVHRGLLFANGSGSLGRVSRTVNTTTENLPSLDGSSSELRGSLGAMVASGTFQVDGGTQGYSGEAGILPGEIPSRSRRDIAIPVTERMRVHGAVVERMGFSVGGESPISTRFSLTAPSRFRVRAHGERRAESIPFRLCHGGRGGW
jgi:hypothetical protein